MTLEQLQDIYSTGFFQEKKHTDPSYITLPIENGWFHIPSHQVSHTEKQLLSKCFHQPRTTQDVAKHPWYSYLFLNQPLSPSTHQYRIIQLQIKKESTLKDEWLTYFSNLFNKIEDAFFIDDTHGILVERKTNLSSSKADIEAMLLTLESEFLIQATLFLGTFYDVSALLPNLFKEEQHIFNTYAKQFYGNDVFSFQDIALNYLTQETMKKSPIMIDIKSSLQLDEEFKQIIHTLWEEQGNMTSASKKLYVHRNTLQYRLDKFYERTGLSLKNMNDLTLCYLVSL